MHIRHLNLKLLLPLCFAFGWCWKLVSCFISMFMQLRFIQIYFLWRKIYVHWSPELLTLFWMLCYLLADWQGQEEPQILSFCRMNGSGMFVFAMGQEVSSNRVFFFFFSAQRWHKSWMPGRNIHLQGGKKPALHSSVIGTDCVVAGWNSVMLLLLQHRDVSVPDCADSQSRKHDTQTQCTVTLFLSPSNLGKCLVSFSCLWLT